MAKKFTKLFLGDLVVTIGGKSFRKLSVGEPTLTAGLYDDEDNLVASWDTLVNSYGMDVEKDYANSSDASKPYYVLTNNTELTDGVKLIVGHVTRIGKYAFASCKLTHISIPDGVTTISSGAFADCYKLTSIEVPDSIVSIDARAFSQCYKLNTTIPISVTSIGEYAFYSCDALTEVTIPDGVTIIAAYSFYGCKSLTSITIPSSVTSIGQNAFSPEGYQYEVLVESITFKGTVAQWNAITKGSNWNTAAIGGQKISKVTCTDGTVTL